VGLPCGAFFSPRSPGGRGSGLGAVLRVGAGAALGCGIAPGVFGTCPRSAPLVAGGRLVFSLLRPRPPLFHLLISQMSVSAWGDVLFGLAVYAAIVGPTPLELVGFLVVALAAGTIIAAHATLANSLAFCLAPPPPPAPPAL